MSNSESDLSKRKNKAKSIIVPHIFNEYHAYCTKTFLIRQFFDDEIVGINELCVFELDLEDYPLPPEASIMIDCELMYGQCPNGMGDDYSAQIQSNQIQFNCVSLYKAEINKENIKTGISEYVPIIFDEDHFNLAGVTLHSCIIDFCHSNTNQQQNAINGQQPIKQQKQTPLSKYTMQPFDIKYEQFNGLKLSKQFN